MERNKCDGFLAYPRKDMQLVMDFVDSLQYTGLAMARKVSTVGTILNPAYRWMGARRRRRRRWGS